MSDDGIEWDDEELSERPFGGRPFGGRPFGGRPFGGKPFGGKPFGGKPFGGKPFGGKPFGGKPFGGKPFGGRPFGGRFADDGYGMGPDDWSVGVAQALCEGSAVIRLGATIVATDDQVWLADSPPESGFRSSVATPGVGAAAQLSPHDDVLEALVAVPDALLARIAEEPGLGNPVIVDLGENLSRVADRALLVDLPDRGTGAAAVPRAISRRTGIEVTAATDLLGTLRKMVEELLGRTPRPAFRNPGWILHPSVLDRVSRIRTKEGKVEDSTSDAHSLASFDLFKLESADEGMLLGFPFATSAEATDGSAPPAPPRIYFGADWQEAWIAVDQSFVTVDLPGAPSVADATVIRASMPVDFALRREDAFAWADPPPEA